MKRFFQRHFKVYEDEFERFLWAALIFFFVFLVMALFRNYVDTAFLKRYNVGKMPLMLVINGALTYFVLGAMNSLGGKFSDRRLLTWFLMGSALIIAGLDLTVRAGADMAYPFLFQMLHLQDTVFLVYLWNMAGDLFDARQGRRIFPLITISQVFATTIGNFCTRPLIHFFGFDFILTLFAASCGFLAVFLNRTRHTVDGHATPGNGVSALPTKRLSEIPSLLKLYPILRYLIVVGMVPNILLPIYTYQFSVIADSAFGSEQALVSFLATFRGVMTSAVLCMLFFMGRIYSRIGLMNASLFQPIHYLLLFGTLTFSFNITIAAFGQCSIRLIQQAVAGPTSKILFNLVPRDLAPWSRVFVRGTVVKVAVVLGSLLTLVLKPWVSPRALAPIAILITLYWLVEVFVFRKRYREGLKQVILDEGVDFDKIDAGWASVEAVSSGAREAHVRAHSEAKCFHDIHSCHVPQISPEVALKQLGDHNELVRADAAASFAVTLDPRAVSRLVRLLEDRDAVRRAATESLIRYGESILPLLEAVLMESPPRVQRGILEILRLSGNRNFDMIPFLGQQLIEAYNNLNCIHVLSGVRGSPGPDLLKAHLEDENHQILSLVFHALWVNFADMGLMYEVLRSTEASAAVEMVETSLDRNLGRYLIPLIENLPVDEKIRLGRKALPLMESESVDRILTALARKSNATTRLLCAYAIGEHCPETVYLPILEYLAQDPHPQVRQVAAYAVNRCMKGDPPMPDIMEVIKSLRNFILFDGMGMNELHALASITSREEYEQGTVILREGDMNSSVYFLTHGAVNAFHGYGSPRQAHRGTIGQGGLFGELRLFTELPSNFTYVVAEPTRVLIIGKNHLHEMMKIYPQISMNFCLFFALRLAVQEEHGEEA